MAASIVIEVESGVSNQEPHLHNGYWAGSFRSDKDCGSPNVVRMVSDIRWQAYANGSPEMAKSA